MEPYAISNNSHFYIANKKMIVQDFIRESWDKDLGVLNKYPHGEKVKNLQDNLAKKRPKEDGSFINERWEQGRWKLKIESHNILLTNEKTDPKGRDVYMHQAKDHDVHMHDDKDIKKARKKRDVGREKEGSHNGKADATKYISEVKVLENEDLLMTTIIGVLIWTVKCVKAAGDSKDNVDEDSEESKIDDEIKNEIRLRYFWTWYDEENVEWDSHLRLPPADFELYLPSPDFDFIIQNQDTYAVGSEKKSPFFKELIADYSTDRFKLDLYGNRLLEMLVDNNENDLIEELIESIKEMTIDNHTKHFVSNIRLLNIIACNFVKLSNQYPNISNRILSLVAFFAPGDQTSPGVVNHYSTSRHHQHLDAFPEISSINLLTPVKRFFNYLSRPKKFFIEGFSQEEGKLTIKLTFPLPNFVSYPSEYNTYSELISPQHSPFTDYDKTQLYKWWNVDNYSLTTPSNSSDPNNPWNLATKLYSVSDGTINETSSLVELPSESTNMFSMLDTSILAVYLMLTGDSSPISSSSLTENITLVIIIVTFSFFTTIYLMNLFIGLLSNAIGETSNYESFLLLKADVLAEIELFYMLPRQRRKHDWFPEFFFYEAEVSKLKDIIISMQNHTYEGLNPPYIPKRLFDLIHVHTKNEFGGNDFEKLMQKIENIEKKIESIEKE
ncbi:6112_t:CDS:2 [Acaulospora colombiana]|uniref:6112_t:CDS:1 n=1 Tax=Acaulospora colombiana TaxID=27376 RepID=A0ACA9JWH7_9GLOM|nr:6112_t:CDS:2 [Acaulospora colombiana]